MTHSALFSCECHQARVDLTDSDQIKAVVSDLIDRGANECAIRILREATRFGFLPLDYFDFICECMASGDDELRTLAYLSATSFLRSQPNLIWDLLVRNLPASDRTFREQLGIGLLERLLIWHFDEYIKPIEEMIRDEFPGMRDALQMCWTYSLKPEQATRIGSLLASDT